ncbi:MAG: nitroreductase family deazaflavin-dependent oxidoreductase [Solirubrobacterales bacterium]
MNVYVAERKRNPFLRSPTGGRVLSALQAPWFRLLPPLGFGVLTMTGRKTGKTRRKCVRAIRRGNRAYVVSIRPTAWLKNVRANPDVRLRVRGGTFPGVVREPRDAGEAQEAMNAYCETVNPFDYGECMMWRRGRPTRAKIKELHRDWFAQGIPLVVELEQ